MSKSEILEYLSQDISTENIHIYDTLESTNETAKEMAAGGCPHGTVVLADCQTAGKGRRGRGFYSPKGSGLYMSVVLHSGCIALPDITMITPAAAVAVCRAIKTVTGIETGIKWVNDILLDGKKVCGILTETAAGSVVVGIGINVNTEHFPEEINQTAASLCVPNIRNRLTAEIINTLLISGLLSDSDKIYNEYKKRLATLGREITVIQGNDRYPATAIDINKSGHLIAQKPGGSIVLLSSGEVSTELDNIS